MQKLPGIKLSDSIFTKNLLAIFSIVGGYFMLIAFDNPGQEHRTLCLFKNATGIPCPGCGMGRATLEIFQGNLITSLQYNLLTIPFTIFIFFSLAWLIADILLRKETFFPFIKRDLSPSGKMLLLIIIMINWAVNIIRGI